MSKDLYLLHNGYNWSYFITVCMPFPVNYSHPEKYGLRGARNFHVKTHDNVTLGVWYVVSIIS